MRCGTVYKSKACIGVHALLLRLCDLPLLLSHPLPHGATKFRVSLVFAGRNEPSFSIRPVSIEFHSSRRVCQRVGPSSHVSRQVIYDEVEVPLWISGKCLRKLPPTVQTTHLDIHLQLIPEYITR